MNGRADNAQPPSSPALNTLAREAEALSNVLFALEAEHQALTHGDAVALESAVADKARALAAHSDARQHRESAGIGPNIQSAVEQNSSFDANQRAAGLALASQLRTAGEQCKQLNQRNGMLIAGLRERTQSALGILRSGESGVTLYGQQGEAARDMGSRVLGTA